MEVKVMPVQGRVLQGDTPEEMSDAYAQMILDMTAKFSEQLGIDARTISFSIIYSVMQTLWWGGQEQYAKDLADDMVGWVVEWEEEAKEPRH